MRARTGSWVLCFGASLLPVAITATWAVMLSAALPPLRGIPSSLLVRPVAPIPHVVSTNAEPPMRTDRSVLANAAAHAPGAWAEREIDDERPPEPAPADVREPSEGGELLDGGEPSNAREPSDGDEPSNVPEPADVHEPLETLESAEPPLARDSTAIDPCDLDDPPHRPARELFFGPKHRKVVALTFDDGPHGRNTPRILEILRQHDVLATFFVLGHRVVKQPRLVTRIAEAGHDVGNHSWSHPSFRSLWKSQLKDEVCRTSDVIEAATGERPSLVRPPYGRYAPSAVDLVGSLGFDLVLWSVDSHDWETDDPERLARAVVRAARSGSIILMHDDEEVTVAALPMVIDGLRRRGFEIEPISALRDDAAPMD